MFESISSLLPLTLLTFTWRAIFTFRVTVRRIQRVITAITITRIIPSILLRPIWAARRFAPRLTQCLKLWGFGGGVNVLRIFLVNLLSYACLWHAVSRNWGVFLRRGMALWSVSIILLLLLLVVGWQLLEHQFVIFAYLLQNVCQLPGLIFQDLILVKDRNLLTSAWYTLLALRMPVLFLRTVNIYGLGMRTVNMRLFPSLLTITTFIGDALRALFLSLYQRSKILMLMMNAHTLRLLFELRLTPAWYKVSLRVLLALFKIRLRLPPPFLNRGIYIPLW